MGSFRTETAVTAALLRIRIVSWADTWASFQVLVGVFQQYVFCEGGGGLYCGGGVCVDCVLMIEVSCDSESISIFSTEVSS